MWLRRVCFGLGLATVFGCSGVTSLIVRNNRREATTIQVQTRYGKDVKDQSFTLPPGKEVDGISWHSLAPDSIRAEATIFAKKVIKQWDPSTYPPRMQKETSTGDYFILDVMDEGFQLREPTAWENFQRDPANILIPLGGGVCFFGCIAVALVVALRSRRKFSAK